MRTAIPNASRRWFLNMSEHITFPPHFYRCPVIKEVDPFLSHFLRCAVYHRIESTGPGDAYIFYSICFERWIEAYTEHFESIQCYVWFPRCFETRTSMTRPGQRVHLSHSASPSKPVVARARDLVRFRPYMLILTGRAPLVERAGFTSVGRRRPEAALAAALASCGETLGKIIPPISASPSGTVVPLLRAVSLTCRHAPRPLLA